MRDFFIYNAAAADSDLSLKEILLQTVGCGFLIFYATLITCYNFFLSFFSFISLVLLLIVQLLICFILCLFKNKLHGNFYFNKHSCMLLLLVKSPSLDYFVWLLKSFFFYFSFLALGGLLVNANIHFSCLRIIE